MFSVFERRSCDHGIAKDLAEIDSLAWSLFAEYHSDAIAFNYRARTKVLGQLSDLLATNLRLDNSVYVELVNTARGHIDYGLSDKGKKNRLLNRVDGYREVFDFLVQGKQAYEIGSIYLEPLDKDLDKSIADLVEDFLDNGTMNLVIDTERKALTKFLKAYPAHLDSTLKKVGQSMESDSAPKSDPHLVKFFACASPKELGIENLDDLYTLVTCTLSHIKTDLSKKGDCSLSLTKTVKECFENSPKHLLTEQITDVLAECLKEVLFHNLCEPNAEVKLGLFRSIWGAIPDDVKGEKINLLDKNLRNLILLTENYQNRLAEFLFTTRGFSVADIAKLISSFVPADAPFTTEGIHDVIFKNCHPKKLTKAISLLNEVGTILSSLYSER
jgi:hypothetical protein